MKNFLNSFSVDLEDWFQGTDQIKLGDFEKYESRIEKSTNKLLGILDQHNVKATFFVLGHVAEKNPELIKLIHSKDHEIASHGYSHELIYNMSPDLFREELVLSKKILEEIIGQEVIGHRASNWSITKKSLWALDIIKEVGFKYDSSIYPVENYLFGIENFSLEPVRLENGLIEIPPSIYQFSSYKFPFAGGFFLRALPYQVIKRGISKLNKNGIPSLVYIHPWELDTNQPKNLPLSAKNHFIHYFRLSSTEAKLHKCFNDHSFGRMDEVFHLRGN